MTGLSRDSATTERFAVLEAFVTDLAVNGLRHDPNPTIRTARAYQDLLDYLRRIDHEIRARAQQALKETIDGE